MTINWELLGVVISDFAKKSPPCTCFVIVYFEHFKKYLLFLRNDLWQKIQWTKVCSFFYWSNFKVYETDLEKKINTSMSQIFRNRAPKLGCQSAAREGGTVRPYGYLRGKGLCANILRFTPFLMLVCTTNLLKPLVYTLYLWIKTLSVVSRWKISLLMQKYGLLALF